MPNTTWIEFMPFEELVSTMARADSVVCHAGVGTIMTALQKGRTTVVIPRQASHDEHVDDHQMDIASRFAERGLVRCVTTETDLAPLLTRRNDDSRRRIGQGSRELRRKVLEAIAAEPRARRGRRRRPARSVERPPRG
jgi:UDP-N-acetylglucosamine transferase subunit ALG13